MTEGRRLLAIGALLALGAAVCFTRVGAEPTKKPDRPSADAASLLAPDSRLTTDMAASRFAEAPVVTYRTEGGDTFFALQIKPDLGKPTVRPRDYLVLIDTSASQAGDSFATAQNLTEMLVNKLGPDDKLAIRTANTKSKDLSNGFQPKAEAVKALALLKQEYPAGATDLKAALTASVNAYQGDPSRQRVLLFIGDGMSILDPINTAVRSDLTAQMIASRIAFFPIPVGNRLDPQTLHGFATGSGGAVVRVNTIEKLESTVQKLLDTVAVPVMYPTRFDMIGGVAEVLPNRLPPLRGDAPTLVVGKLTSGDKIGYKVAGQIAGQDVTKEKTETAPEPEVENFFLVSLVSQWRNAAELPAMLRADRALASAEQTNQLARADLLAQAEWALGEDRWEVAERLYKQAAQIDPHNTDIKAGLEIVKKLRIGAVTKDQLREQVRPKDGETVVRVARNDKGKISKERILKLAREQADPKPGGAPADPGVVLPQNPADILREAKQRQAVEDQRMTQIVNEAIRQSSRSLRLDPDGARDQLKNILDGVRGNPDISDGVRQRLTMDLERNLRSVEVAGIRIKQDLEEQMRKVAEARAQFIAMETEIASQERIRERMRVIHTLMNQARDLEAQRQAEALWMDLENEGREPPPAVLAGYMIGQRGHHLRQYRDLIRLRQDRFLLTMLEVEKSAVPFPDEPPIQYPPAATWKALYELRKQRYEASNLGDDVPKGTYRLQQKMKDPVDFKGLPPDPKMTLSEALEFLADRYDLTFDINDAAFKAEMVEDVLAKPVAEKEIPRMRNVSLDTVLRRILARVPSQSGATYLIRRDVIEITTGLAARSENVTRVYPVADLVIPIPQSINQQSLQQSATIFGQFGAAGGGGGLPGLQIGGFGGGAGNLGGMGGFNLGGGFQLGGQLGAIGGLNLGGAVGFQLGGAGGLNGGLNLGQGVQGGQANLGVGGGALGFGGGQLGQFGNLGGQFGFQGGDTSQLLIYLITTTIGKPQNWRDPNQNPFVNPNPGGPPAEEGFNNQGWSLGYYPPALALVVKAPSRIHTRVGGPTLDQGGLPPLMGNAGGGRDGIVRIGGPKEENPVKPDVKIVAKPDKPKDPVKPANADADPRKIWEDALAKGVTEPGLIIACADYMALAGQFEHTAEFLKANLRKGIVVQPWVFESLAIALKESKASPEEVERAEMSEADLEPMDADGFLRASQSMATHKRFDHALAFCKQAAALAPGNPYVYTDALEYATQVKDVDAMNWAAGNLLKRDWPVDNQKLQLKARDRLTTLAQTVGKTDPAAAKKLEATAVQTRERDLVIRIAWQGEADLDLKVLEPTGSTCSWLNRQSVGGGTLLGDTLAEPNRESYVAARAFPGEYKVTVERTWGKTIGDKAQLEIVRHQGTPQETSELVTVNFAQTNTIAVTLDSGRRTSAASVPTAEEIQKPTPPAALGGVDKVFNQLRAISDRNQPTGGLSGGAGGMGVASRAQPTTAPKVTDPNREQVIRQTGVKPFFTNSADVTTQAVISADRRYVRLSMNVMFNGVTGVNLQPVIGNPLIPGFQPPLGAP